MMKHEFEELAGYEVSTEDYNNIIEPMYMATNLSKTEFAKCINRKQFEKKPEIKLTPVFISNGIKTPNGCYYVGSWMMQVGNPKTNIRTGKTTFTVRETTPEEQHKIGWDRWCYSSIDIWSGNERFIIKKI